MVKNVDEKKNQRSNNMCPINQVNGKETDGKIAKEKEKENWRIKCPKLWNFDRLNLIVFFYSILQILSINGMWNGHIFIGVIHFVNS